MNEAFKDLNNGMTNVPVIGVGERTSKSTVPSIKIVFKNQFRRKFSVLFYACFT